MLRKLFLLLLAAFSFSLGSCQGTKQNPVYGSILKIKISKSAFGVEADDIPSIEVYVDFTTDSSRCERTFYNPAYKGSVYSFSKNKIAAILNVLNNADLEKLKTKYTANKSDQSTSTITIYTTKQTFTITDYGMVGEDPLPELYKLVYKE